MCIRSFVLRPAAGIALVAALAACGGTSSTPAPITFDETPASATTTTCVSPSTSAQTVSLPATAGFTGSLSVAAAAAAAPSCDVSITVATGTDVSAPSAQTAAAARRIEATGSTSGPILDISMSNAFSNNVAITGTVLNTPPNLTFPDGTYSALVVSGTLPPTVLVFTATGGVLTLQSTGQPILIVPGTTSVLYLYPRGVTPTVANAPTPSPSASASATPTPAPSTSPSTLPSATPTPTVAPLPSPTASATITATVTLSPASCVAYGYAGASPVYTAIVSSNAPSGTTFMYGWFTNTGFGLTVPPPSSVFYDSSTENDVQLGAGTTATLTVPTFAPGNGTGGSIGVVLFMVDPTYGNVVPVMARNGAGVSGSGQAGAFGTVEAGVNTCS